MTTPSEAISTAMAERGFRQADLLDIFGSRGRASEIINGKRAVPRSMIPKLALRLGIPLDVLIAPPREGLSFHKANYANRKGYR